MDAGLSHVIAAHVALSENTNKRVCHEGGQGKGKVDVR